MSGMAANPRLLLFNNPTFHHTTHSGSRGPGQARGADPAPSRHAAAAGPRPPRVISMHGFHVSEGSTSAALAVLRGLVVDALCSAASGALLAAVAARHIEEVEVAAVWRSRDGRWAARATIPEQLADAFWQRQRRLAGSGVSIRNWDEAAEARRRARQQQQLQQQSQQHQPQHQPQQQPQQQPQPQQ